MCETSTRNQWTYNLEEPDVRVEIERHVRVEALHEIDGERDHRLVVAPEQRLHGQTDEERFAESVPNPREHELSLPRRQLALNCRRHVKQRDVQSCYVRCARVARRQ